MAVEKLSGTTNVVKIIRSGVALENALSRFYEQCSRQEPSVLRKRLKKHLADVKVSINGGFKTEEA